MRSREFTVKLNENNAAQDHEKLAAAAEEQRGGPEIAMVEAQKLHGGGVLSFCIEHTGDLYNRMHNTGYGNLGNRSSDNERREVVLEKIAKVLRVLTNPYGFEKEHEENMKSNPKSMNVPPQEYRDRLEKALERYAEEHRKLPVYNLPQKLARQASMALGLGQYGTARLALWDLQDLARDKEKWFDIVNVIDPKYSKQQINENFADGKIKGKSRPGRVKRAGASCKGSVTDLRAKAKKYSGERGKMYQWCLNMKAGRKK